MQCFCLLPLLTRDRTSWPSEGCPPPSLPLSSFAFTGVPPSKSLADLILSWVSASGRDPTHTNPFWHPLMDLASLLCFAYHCVPDPIFFFFFFYSGSVFQLLICMYHLIPPCLSYLGLLLSVYSQISRMSETVADT